MWAEDRPSLSISHREPETVPEGGTSERKGVLSWKLLAPFTIQRMIIIIVVISVAPYLTDKVEHTALYKINQKCVH